MLYFHLILLNALNLALNKLYIDYQNEEIHDSNGHYKLGMISDFCHKHS